MSDTFADVTHAALDLDDQEREQLAGLLHQSLDHVDEIDGAWMDEARRRYEAIRSGSARTLPHGEVVARLEARFGSKEERARLIDAALVSIDDPGPLSPAWRAELERRGREIDNGEVELIDNDDVFAYVRVRLR